MKRRRLAWSAGLLLLAGVLGCAVVAPPLRAEDSLGEKIKRIFEPTPPPRKKHKSTAATKKRSTPSPTPKRKSSPSPTETPSPSPKKEVSPSPSPRPKHSPSPSPSASPKKKKKSSASPTPTPTPTATPEESPSPSPRESPTPSPSPAKKEKPPGVSIQPNDIKNFDDYPAPVRKLITSALELSARDLSYKYGSADPAEGGMDCSGFIYYVLRAQGLKEVPRDASEQYVWVRKSGSFRAVVGKSDETFELEELKPGDLLFWTGTYDVQRDPPVTHAMIYLGREKSTGRRVMVGASDGRTYHDESRYGVSVFDFRNSRPGHSASNGRTPDFIGYGRVPGLGEE